MCLDLRYPNSQTAWARFKLATLLNTLPHELRQGDIIFTDDLDSAYHSVMMHEDTWPYMCFDSPLGLVCPTVLSFGDGLAPFIFSKITRPITAFCHVIGLRIMSYLDDFPWMALRENADSTKRFAQWLMPALGWISNTAKADWSMGSVKESLGFVVDAEAMRLRVPADKISTICDLITEALGGPVTNVGLVHSIWGKIVSLRPALQGASAYCYETGRQIVEERAKGKEGPDLMTLSQASRDELGMLKIHIAKWGPVGLPIPNTSQQIEVWSDAGEVGYGGHLGPAGPGDEHSGVLPPELIGASSTRRELYAIRKTAIALGDRIRGKRVLFHVDSRASVFNMLNQGGSIRELNTAYREWIQTCEDLRIEAYYAWLPREENVRADKLSKRVPLSWALSSLAAETVQKGFPDTAVTLPDLNQIANTICAAQREGRNLLLVHPVWPASAWWKKIVSLGVRAWIFPGQIFL